MGKLRDLVKLARPWQWYKNLLAFAAVLFGGKLLDPYAWASALEAFFLLSLVSSSSYVINDVVDYERDRLHPVKRFRPVAAGRVSRGEALALAVLLASAAVLISVALNPAVTPFLIALLASQLTYSLKLRESAPADVIVISLNYTIRAVCGAVTVELHPSPWLVTGSFVIALMLILGKRRGEVEVVGERALEFRKPLAVYSKEVLRGALFAAAAALLATYIAYCSTHPARPLRMAATTPLAAYLVLRYVLVVERFPKLAEEPHNLARDRGLLGGLLAWLLAIVLALYA